MFFMQLVNNMSTRSKQIQLKIRCLGLNFMICFASMQATMVTYTYSVFWILCHCIEMTTTHSAGLQGIGSSWLLLPAGLVGSCLGAIVGYRRLLSCIQSRLFVCSALVLVPFCHLLSVGPLCGGHVADLCFRIRDYSRQQSQESH